MKVDFWAKLALQPYSGKLCGNCSVWMHVARKHTENLMNMKLMECVKIALQHTQLNRVDVKIVEGMEGD